MSFKPNSVLSMAALLLSTTAMAQALPSEEPVRNRSQDVPRQLEEIVVTAQKREESLREVPISITAFTREDIQEAGIKSVSDIADLTPSLVFNEYLDIYTNVTIRGIGALGGSQSTFAMYLDGFEVTGGSAVNLVSGLADLERIEVLRGPQGTTFGRNITAGAINMTSVAPDYELSGQAALEISDFGGLEGHAAVNIPLYEDVAAIRISGFSRHSDGWVKNTGSAGDDADSDKYGFRAALRVEPSERLTWDTSLAYQKLEQGRSNFVTDGVLIGALLSVKDIIDFGFGLVPPGSIPAGATPYFPGQNTEIQTNTPANLTWDSLMATNRIQYDLGAFSLVSVSGYIRNELDNIRDGDNSDFDLFNEGTTDGENEFWSTELRAQSNGDDRLNWVGGVYAAGAKGSSHYFVRTGTEAELLTHYPSALSGLPFDASLLPNNTRIVGNFSGDEARSYAVFAEADYEVVDRLHLALGIRGNRDEISEFITDAVNLGADEFGMLTGVPTPDDAKETSSEEVTWRGTLRYEMSEAANVYGTVSKGYRAGGLQLNNPFKPDYGAETIINYELGLKALLFDRRLSINTAAFVMDWTDIQIVTTDRTNNQSFTDNAGGAKAKGFEVDAQALPLDSLTLTAGLSFVDTEITDFIDSTGLDRSGTVLPAAPEWHLNLSAHYQRPLFADTDGFIRATWIYNDKQLEGLVDGATELQFIDSYERVDLRVGLESDRWRIEAFADNVFDEIYGSSILLNGYSLSGAEITSMPRLYGIKGTVTF